MTQHEYETQKKAITSFCNSLTQHPEPVQNLIKSTLTSLSITRYMYDGPNASLKPKTLTFIESLLTQSLIDMGITLEAVSLTTQTRKKLTT